MSLAFGAESRGPSRALLSAVFLLLAAGAQAGPLRISISPQVVELQAKPGSAREDALAFFNESDTPLTVSVTIVDFLPDQTGRVIEKPAGVEADSIARSMRISPITARVAPQQTVYFRYRIEAPAEFTQLRGVVSFRAVPDAQGNSGGSRTIFVPVLGILCYVENPAAAPGRLEVNGVTAAREKDRLLLSLRVTNKGQRNIRPTGFVRVRSKDGAFDESYPFNDGRGAVLPGFLRDWELRLGPVPGGEPWRSHRLW